jgi:hypothetical protein
MIKYENVHICITHYERNYELKQQKTVSTPTYLSRVTYHEDIKVLWNQGIQTDREVLANRSDIIVKNEDDKTCLPIDAAIPSDRNVMQKEAEKKLKYKTLGTEFCKCGTSNVLSQW